MYTSNELKKIFSTEEFFLITICRLFFNKATVQEAEVILVSSTIDYDKLYSIASAHGVRPVLYTVITKNDLAVNPVFLSKLKTYFETNQVHSFEKFLWISKLTAIFNQQGIKVIPLKGVLFASSYYGNIALRESSDIDFLVSPDDVEAIQEMIATQGFAEKLTVPPAFMSYCKQHFKDMTYIIPSNKRQKGYTLEFHWRMLDTYMGDFPTYEFFKKGLTAVSINNISFDKLSPAYDLTSVISNHFIKDLSVKFKYLMDVAAVIEHNSATIGEVDIRQLVQKHFHTRKAALGLSLLKNLLGVEIENWKVTESFSLIYSKQVLRVPVMMHRFLVMDPAFLKRSFRLQDNAKQKFHFVKRCLRYMMLPTHNDIKAYARLPLPLMFFLRPFRLAGKKMRRSIGL